MTAYSIIIPVYERYETTKNLLEDIHAYCHFPGDRSIYPNLARILLVDDGSSSDEIKYLASLFSTSKVIVEHVKLDHKGPAFAISEGLKLVDTEFAIVLSSDVRLASSKTLDEIEVPTASDPLGYLAKALLANENAAITAPFVLLEEAPSYVAFLYFEFSPDGFLPSITGMLHDANEFLKWGGFSMRSVPSVKGTCIGIRTEAAKAVDYLDNPPHPYYRWWDEICLRVRALGKYVLFTSHALVLHPMYSEKPEGSFSVLTQAEVDEANRKFYERWKDKPELFRPRSVFKQERREMLTPEFLSMLARRGF